MIKTLHFATFHVASRKLQNRRMDVLKTSLFVLVLTFFGATSWGQTNPSTANLPFTFNGSSSVPASMAIHRFGTSTGAIPTSRITTDGVADLPTATASNSGGYILEGSSGADGISMLASGSQSSGAIVSEISTLAKTSISVSWVAWTVLDQASYTCSIALQYRVGESGAWINVDNPSSSVYSTSTTGRANGVSYSQTLPVGAENQSIIQVRWIYWISSGSAGSRDRLAIDNISITGSASCTNPTISLVSLTNPLCNGMSNGAIDLTVSAGTVAWNDGNTNVNRTDLAAGTYTVTATDGTCSATASYTLTQPSLLSVTASNTGNYCDGGVVNLSAAITGGSGVYPITTWSGPNSYSASTSTATVSPVVLASSGTYSLTVVDNNGCSGSANTSFAVTSFGAAGVSLSPATATCTGTNVTVTATPTNGGSSPTYAWYLNNVLQSESSSMFTFTPSNGDQVYSVMTSNSGCVSGNPATSSVSTYTVNPNPVATASITNLSCFASNDGAIDITMSSGTAPFNFVWTGGASTEDRVSLSAGNYNVTITDANSCAASYTYSITQPNAITAGTLSSNSPQCLGASINLNSTAFVGGVGSLTYIWTGPNSFTSNGLSVSTIPTTSGVSVYTITATDLNGCSSNTTVNVNIHALPTATASNNGPVCEGETIQLNGGASGNTSYSWSGPSGYSASSITVPYTQNFNSLVSSGSTTWVDNSTIPNWYSQRTGNGTTITVDAGTNTAGGLYSYGSTGNSERALGTLGSSNAAAGNFAHGVLLQNTSGVTITDVTVSYTLEQWRNSAASAHALNVYYKTSSTPITDLTPNVNSSWTAVPGLTLTSPITGGTAGSLNGNSAANKVSATNVSLGSISLANNQYIMIKWEDPDQTGSDHGLSIDDVAVTMIANQQNTMVANMNAAKAGDYVITVTNSNGCSSTSSTTVVVNPLPTATPTVQGSSSICIGSSATLSVALTGTGPWAYELNDGTSTVTRYPTSSPDLISVSPTATTTYTVQNVIDNNLCLNEAMASTTVVVNPLPSAELNGISPICVGSSTSLTISFTGSGPWTYSINNGTTATTSLNPTVLTVNPTEDKTYTITGVTDINGCIGSDSNPFTVEVEHSTQAVNGGSSTICAGESATVSGAAALNGGFVWTHNGLGTLTDETTITPTYHSVIGDQGSTVVLTLTVSNICGDDSKGFYVHVNEVPTATISGTATICKGESSLLHVVLTGNGPWDIGLNDGASTTISSLNSLVNNISVNPANTTTYSILSVEDVNGCQSVGIGDALITVNNPTSSNTSVTQCNNYTWPISGVMYSASGTYIHTNINAQGCLNTDTLMLTINQSNNQTQTFTACNSYVWNGNTYTTSGTYYAYSVGTNGCNDTTTLLLTVNYSNNSTVNQTVCNSYVWNGNTYTSSGTYFNYSVGANGCADTATLNLIINQSTYAAYTEVSCNSYTWINSSSTYTSSGNYIHTYLNSSNCASADTLHLTINQSTSNSTTITNCDSYLWSYNNVTYTTSGTYTVTSLNSSGCLHSESLLLTINNSTTHSETISACNSYQWLLNGITYTTSGTYTFTSLNTSGCTHTETLILTINQTTSHYDVVIECDSYLWPYNGVTYTATGAYTVTSVNAAGCTHAETLYVTIKHSSSNGSITATACNSYLWNGNTYTTSGTYTYTSLNLAGCVNTATLFLTILESTSSTNTVSACDSYTWNANNATYTSSGTYSFTTTNISGCSHVETLVLSINSSSSNSVSITNCDSYTWPYNTTTYTTSGTYTITSTNAAGCLHSEILQLTINQSSSNTNTISSCDSYTWNYNNQTYTSSGMYTVTSLNSSGCIHSEILVLTITPSATITSTITNCGTYTWPVNGVTYTSSGTYSVTSSCTTQVLNLNLLATFTYTSNTTSKGCYTWTMNGNTYSTSGVYTHTATNATTGCAEEYILNLTVIPGIKLTGKVLLQGPFDSSTGLMSDSLRAKGRIPLTEPYTSAPYNKLFTSNEPSSETIDPSLFLVTGNDAIVDWVYLELRNPLTGSTVLYTKRALIQRDGDIVSNEDGQSPVFFTNVPAGNYFVCIKHRNHLGVMYTSPITFTSCNSSNVDFVTGLVAVYAGIINQPRKQIGSQYLLWSGDCNNNKNVKYNGLSNDKDQILTAVGAGTPNNSIDNVYRTEDVNMDGKVRYNNADNDRVLIINNVGTSTPNRIISQHTGF